MWLDYFINQYTFKSIVTIHEIHTHFLKFDTQMFETVDITTAYLVIFNLLVNNLNSKLIFNVYVPTTAAYDMLKKELCNMGESPLTHPALWYSHWDLENLF